MEEVKKIATRTALIDLGFQPDGKIISEDGPGLIFDFGNCKLSANWVMNLRYVNVVLFTGVMASPRSGAEVVFEISRHVESREQCMAWIVWNLDNASNEHTFCPLRDVAWVPEGRKHIHLLPWMRPSATMLRKFKEYDARPHCSVEREWMKLALRTLTEHLARVEDTEPVEITFDGKILSFLLAGNNVVLAAQGSPWGACFTLPAGKLRNLPKRFMRTFVDVSVSGSHLYIDRFMYDKGDDIFGSLNKKEGL